MNAERSLHHLSESSFRVRCTRWDPLPYHLHWPLVAVALLWFIWLSWPAPAAAMTGGACSHSVCELGGKLVENCDATPVVEDCVSDICGPPNNDTYCCTAEWDQNCIDQVLTICGDPTCAQICEHSPCDVGVALDSTCNDCTATVCFNHPSCCTDDGDPLTDDWDQFCVDRVADECGVQCEPGADLCSEAIPIQPGTIYGTLLGSTNDGCDGGVAGEPSGVSCRSGDVWYEYTQGIADDMVLSTCSTQRSYAIDTVISVHEGATVFDRCPGVKGNKLIANDDWQLGLTEACSGIALPRLLDSGLPLSGIYALAPGETVVIRVAHHDDSAENNFTLKLLPEPEAWLALLAGAGALSALSRRRARG